MYKFIYFFLTSVSNCRDGLDPAHSGIGNEIVDFSQKKRQHQVASATTKGSTKSFLHPCLPSQNESKGLFTLRM